MRIDLHVFIHNGDAELQGRLDAIQSSLDALKTQGEKMSQQIQDLQAAVAAEDTVIASAITLLNGLSAQIIALKDDPAALAALAADVNTQAQALAAAVAANTPAA